MKTHWNKKIISTLIGIRVKGGLDPFSLDTRLRGYDGIHYGCHSREGA